MSEAEDKVKELQARLGSLESQRHEWESNWQEIRDYVRPWTSDFQRVRSPGQLRTEKIYDGTAPQALEELAAGLQSFLTSPAERWFELKVEGEVMTPRDDEALEWLELVSDLIFEQYSRQETNFNSSIQEVYQDLGAFGTAVINQEWSFATKSIRFKAVPLADCFVAENDDGMVDMLFRKLEMTLRQLLSQFDDLPPQLLEKNIDPTRKYCVVHACYPRNERDLKKMTSTNKPVASVWYIPQFTWVLKESGFDEFPFHVPRWTKLAGEIYGRSPALQCLPDIRMLNRMELTNIKAAQKAVDPPLLVPHDSFLRPLKMEPNSINYKEPGTDPVEKLEFSGQWPVAIEITNQKREHIRQCFFSDWLRMEKEKIEMTAFEVQDRRDEKLRFLAPMLGRIESELLGPMVARSFNILQRRGYIPPVPASLDNTGLKVGFVSPASRAQLGMKAVSNGRWIQELIPVAQTNPEVMDVVDLDAYAEQLGFLRGASRLIIRSPEEVEQIRDARRQQQQMEQMAQGAQALQPAAKAVRDLSEANQAGNIF